MCAVVAAVKKGEARHFEAAGNCEPAYASVEKRSVM